MSRFRNSMPALYILVTMVILQFKRAKLKKSFELLDKILANMKCQKSEKLSQRKQSMVSHRKLLSLIS